MCWQFKLFCWSVVIKIQIQSFFLVPLKSLTNFNNFSVSVFRDRACNSDGDPGNLFIFRGDFPASYKGWTLDDFSQWKKHVYLKYQNKKLFYCLFCSELGSVQSWFHSQSQKPSPFWLWSLKMCEKSQVCEGLLANLTFWAVQKSWACCPAQSHLYSWPFLSTKRRD